MTNRAPAHEAFHRLGADAVGWWKPSRELNFTRLDDADEAYMRFHDSDALRAAESVFVSGWVEALRWREAAESVMVSDQLRGAFADLITAKLREGWRLHGQPFHAGGAYHQLMTRGVQP